MNKITAIIGFVTLIVTVISSFAPTKIDNDTVRFIIVVFSELKFELILFSFVILSLSFSNNLVSIYKKYIDKHKVLIVLFIGVLFLSLMDDIKYMCRARVYFYQKNFLYAKYHQYIAKEYITLVTKEYYYDSEKFYKKMIKDKFNESSMSYVQSYKSFADSVIRESEDSFGKYQKILKLNNNKLTRIGVVYLYKAYIIYPKNNKFVSEINKAHRAIYNGFKSIPVLFSKCNNSEYFDFYTIYKEDSWLYLDRITAGYLLPDNLSSQEKIESMSDKFCEYLLRTSEEKFIKDLGKSWQLSKLYTKYSPDNKVDGI